MYEHESVLLEGGMNFEYEYHTSPPFIMSHKTLSFLPGNWYRIFFSENIYVECI